MKFKKILTIGIDEAKLDPEYWKQLDQLTTKRVSLPKDSPDIKQHLADADCLLVSFTITVDQHMIEHAPNLRYIGVLATAFGKIDLVTAAQKGIIVCNIPGYSTESVAEFILASILEHIRQLTVARERAHKGNYSEAGLLVTEIKGKVFGILGLGAIGSRVAEIALGFGADVRYWSRTRKKDLEQKGVIYEDMDHLIQTADFLSVNLAQTKETEGIFDEKRMQSIKSGAIVVNTAPMELVNIAALDKRLAQGDITFIMDHADQMKPNDLQPLLKHTNCIIYPPIAYISQEARLAKQDIFLKNLQCFLTNTPINKVN